MDNGFVCVCSVSTKMPVMGNVRTVSTYMCKHLHLIVREYMNVFFLVQVCAFVSMVSMSVEEYAFAYAAPTTPTSPTSPPIFMLANSFHSLPLTLCIFPYLSRSSALVPTQQVSLSVLLPIVFESSPNETGNHLSEKYQQLHRQLHQ